MPTRRREKLGALSLGSVFQPIRRVVSGLLASAIPTLSEREQARGLLKTKMKTPLGEPNVHSWLVWVPNLV
jgi:hypothetical protein